MKSLTRWGVVVAALVALVGYSNSAFALHQNVPVPASGCLGGKIKCVSKKKACLLGLYKKVFNPDPLAIAKCMDKFDASPAIPGKGCFEKLEAKGGCLSTGDAPVIEAKVDAFVKDLIAEMNPTGATGTNKCSNGKVACVLKYNSCILGLYGKAAKAGGLIGDITKCRTGLSSCVGKLEVKYGDVCTGGTADGDSCVPDNGLACVGGGGSCGGNSCLTTQDVEQLLNKDDAFIDDVVAELVTDGVEMDTQRCSGDTRVKCTTAPGGVGGCGGPLGLCQFFFGSPLPLAAGGVATCVTNQWAGGISGTFNQATGASIGTANVLATVYGGIDISTPCPRCAGDGYPNDGLQQGNCQGGAHNGMPCDANGRSPEASTFGDTSLDCGPTGQIAAIPVDLSNTTGTNTQTVTASSPNCNGAPGDKCLCASCTEDSQKPCKTNADCVGTCSNGAGAARQATPCVDETSTVADESLCGATAVPGEGECPVSPVNQKCKIQTFRSCIMDTDCTTGLNADPNDKCLTFGRECFPGYNGQVGATITAQGSLGLPVGAPPRNHASTQTFASVFCVAPTSAPGVNAAAGLPGPGRLQLGGVGFENASAGVCPTTASFLPTFKGGVLDTGWTGIAHDAKVVSSGKVTVSVSACSGAADSNGNGCGTCTYSGPIPNPNIAP